MGNTGRYEVYEVIYVSGNDGVVAENGTLCNSNSLIYSYDLGGRTQVIRMPQFDNLTIGVGGSINTLSWNGTLGGVVALDVNNTLTVNGQINAAERGFRGGVIENLTTASGTDVTAFRGTVGQLGAEKGESIIGFQTEYDANNGRFARGAPANGGGGGTSHNGGGGGGANGDNGLSWTGQGNPDSGVMDVWAPAWNLDPNPALNASTTSSGGGRGGYSYGRNNQNALVTPPGSSSWGGNSRRERGGLGGRPLPFDDVGRIFFGGGGGAGDGNNNQAGAGGSGGGLIYVITSSLTGTGTINANGQNGLNTAGGGNNDAPGGGGAGGTIVISANSTTASINLTATGGKGGDQLPIGNENEGPGGGGGGGVISLSGGTGISTATGGANGITQSTAMTEFLPNGATFGGSGQPSETTSNVLDLPVCRATSLITTKALTNHNDVDLDTLISENDILTYTVVVTNTSDIALTNVTVTDSLITPSLATCATLSPGDSCELVGIYTVLSGDVTTGFITNTAIGDSNETPPDDATVVVEIGQPSLNIEKSITNNADGDGSGSVTENDVLTYTVIVTNTGNVPLTNVIVTDSLITPTGGSTPCANVPVGGTCTLIGTYTVDILDVNTGSITNTATGNSNETPSQDVVLVTPVNSSPELTVNKTAVITTDNGTPGVADEGDVITFTVTVENTGNVVLDNLVVNDPMGGGALTCAPTTLNPMAPGNIATCNTYTYTVLQNDVNNGGTIDNTATATADDPDDNQVGDDDSTSTPIVTGVPGLVTTKALTGNLDEDGSNNVTLGDTLTFTVTATNTGNITLTNVTVTDSMITPNNTTCATLLPGNSCVLVGTYQVMPADVTLGNISNTGTGDSNETPPDPETIDTPVLNPGLTVTKTAVITTDNGTPGVADEGDVITFTVTVENTGNVVLDNLVVNDPMGGGALTCAPTTLNPMAPGNIATCNTYTYTVLQNDVNNGGTIDNTATATADDPDDNQVGDDDSTSTPIVVQGPSMVVTKDLTANADEDMSGTISLNDTLTYTITATNNGNVTLNNVVVTDTITTPNNIMCSTVDPGATCVLIGTYVVQQVDLDLGEIENTGTADSDETQPVTDVVVTPVTATPGIAIDKTLTSNADEDGTGDITLNDTLTFTIVVTNVGNVTLTDLVVTDSMITPNTITCVSVPVNQTCVLIGTYVVTQQDVDNRRINNTAEGVANETGPEPVTDVITVSVFGPLTKIPTLSIWSFFLMLVVMGFIGIRRTYKP